MPLITPASNSYQNYLKYQITGSYNIAYSLRCPMIIHESFSDFEDFKHTCIFYSDNNLVQTIGKLLEDTSTYESCKRALLKDATFNIRHNSEQLIHALVKGLV